MEGFVVTNNRIKKAKKIESVLEHFLGKKVENLKILDIGCGNGEISLYFSNLNNCFAVDVRNQLTSNSLKNIKFKKVDSSNLPFEHDFFDIVISNHVIEHIGNHDNHLSEIYRVLKDEGICYFATPNRNFPIEPHHKIPLIHYFPNDVFHLILKKIGVYEENLFLMKYSEMKNNFIKNSFEFKEYTGKILKYPKEFNLETGFFKIFPLFLLDYLSFLSQTNIFVLKKKK